MSELGVFAVDRGIFTDPDFADEPFTEREAFMWLVSLSESGATLDFSLFSRRWGWDRRRVQRFLKKIVRLKHATINESGLVTKISAAYSPSSKIKLDARDAIPTSIRKSVFEKQGMVCTYCGDTAGPFEIDHIVPWSRGGDNSPKNLCVSCRTCNRAKLNRTPHEMGWSR